MEHFLGEMTKYKELFLKAKSEYAAAKAEFEAQQGDPLDFSFDD